MQISGRFTLGVPFVHSHKNNEEIYVVLSGKGQAVIDGETVEISKVDFIRVASKAKRQFQRLRIVI